MLSWELVAPLVAAIGGCLAYAMKKYVDWKVDRALAAQLEALRKLQALRVDALVRIQGGLAEVAHCMNHIREGHADYLSKCKELCMKIRQDARASIAVIGDELMSEVQTATDKALVYVDGRSEEVLLSWESALERAFRRARTTLKTLG